MNELSRARRVVIADTPAEMNQKVWRFFALRLLYLRRVLVHILLVDPAPVLKLKKLPILGRRLRCLIEHEGDIASECLYRWAYGKFEPPPDEPPAEFRAEYDYIVAKQKTELLQADGAILVTKEHLALWEKRLGSPLNALVLPTMFDSMQFSFAPDRRQALRAELGLSDKLVLVYSGSVSMPWQRFEHVLPLHAAPGVTRLSGLSPGAGPYRWASHGAESHRSTWPGAGLFAPRCGAGADGVVVVRRRCSVVSKA